MYRVGRTTVSKEHEYRFEILQQPRKEGLDGMGHTRHVNTV